MKLALGCDAALCCTRYMIQSSAALHGRTTFAAATAMAGNDTQATWEVGLLPATTRRGFDSLRRCY